MSRDAWLLLFCVLLPSLLALALFLGLSRSLVARLLPLAPWPALAAAAAVLGQPPSELSAVIFGGRFGVSLTDWILLASGALVWTLVGFRLSPEVGGRRWLGFALVAQTGSLGALISYDVGGFYFFFSMMTIASYGLIDVAGSPAERSAGRIYLALALFGEFLALAAFMLAQSTAPATLAVGWLLFMGLGAKLGVPPFHVALPLAYGAAPSLSGALLASVMLNAAIAGLLRFLPMAQPAFADLSAPFIAIGLVMGFGAAAVGVMQREPRALLGYSTMSQMGIAAAAIGIAAGAPASWSQLTPAIALFALHHGLIKAALFLGLDVGAGSGRRRTAFALLSLALAAAPLSGGALAKLWIEEGLYAAPKAQVDLLRLLLPLTSASTALLMARFIFLLPSRSAAISGEVRGTTIFAVSVGAALIGPWAAAAVLHPDPWTLAVGSAHIWTTAWPLGVALTLLAVAWRLRDRLPLPSIPAGDMAVWLSWLSAQAERFRWKPPPVRMRRGYVERILAKTRTADAWTRSFRAFGLAYLGLLALLALLAFGS